MKMRYNPFVGDAIWVFFFLAVHIVVLLSSGIYYEFTEELFNGRIAWKLMERNLTLGREMQFTPYAGGTFIEALCIIPFFKLFGSNLFAVKIVPLMFMAATLWFWRIYFRWNGPPGSETALSLLMIFPPPYVTKISMVAWGNHMESACLIACAWILFTWASRGQSPLFGSIVFGLWCGFSTYFITSFLINVLVAGILVIFYKRHPIFKFRILPALLGFVIGLIPWFLVNIEWGFKGLKIFQTLWKPHDAAFLRFIRRLWEILTYHLPHSAGFFPEDQRLAFWTGVFYFGLGGLLIAGLVKRQTWQKAIPGIHPFWIYIVLFIIALGLSNFEFDKNIELHKRFRIYRYFASLYPMFLAMFAWGYGKWRTLSNRWIRSVATILLGIMIILGAGSLTILIRPASEWHYIFKEKDFSGVIEFRMIKEK